MSGAINQPVCSLFAAFLLAAVGAFTIHCGSPQGEREGGADALTEGFLKAIESAQAEGIHVYWLGKAFGEDGLTYTVTDVVLKPDLYGFGRELRIEYAAESPGGRLLLPISLQTKEDWEFWAPQRAAALRGYTAQVLPLGDWDAVLYVKRGLSPDRQQARLVVDTGDTVIGALASPTIDENGRQTNPFSIAPDRLLAVMENLRPYPE